VLLINLALPSTKAIGTTTLEITSTVSAKGERITSNNQVTNEKQALTPTEHDRKVGGNNQEKEEVIEVTQPRVEMPLEQSGDVKQEENTRESPKLVEFSTSDKKDVEHSASENSSQLNQTFVTKEIIRRVKTQWRLIHFCWFVACDSL